MRRILQRLLRQPLTWIGNYLSASPKKEIVIKSLSNLYSKSRNKRSVRTKVLDVDTTKDRFIIFSDQHKGNKSWSDDFKGCELNYLAALQHYNSRNFIFINLGDSEELWKFKAEVILPANEEAFTAEAAFHPHRYYKTFGNHDIIWKNKLDVLLYMTKYFKMPLHVYEGIVLKITNEITPLDIFLTHGHQGDIMSDNNAVSTWIVAHIWMPLQRYLRININSPSKDFTLRNKHNRIMYDWSSKKRNLVLITGHTHKPVFASGRYLDHPSNDIKKNEPKHTLKPSYFNTGCCCYDDGDITGIEIADGYIRLIKWFDEEVKPKKMVLEEIEISKLIQDLM